MGGTSFFSGLIGGFGDSYGRMYQTKQQQDRQDAQTRMEVLLSAAKDPNISHRAKRQVLTDALSQMPGAKPQIIQQIVEHAVPDEQIQTGQADVQGELPHMGMDQVIQAMPVRQPSGRTDSYHESNVPTTDTLGPSGMGLGGGNLQSAAPPPTGGMMGMPQGNAPVVQAATGRSINPIELAVEQRRAMLRAQMGMAQMPQRPEVMGSSLDYSDADIQQMRQMQAFRQQHDYERQAGMSDQLAMLQQQHTLQQQWGAELPGEPMGQPVQLADGSWAQPSRNPITGKVSNIPLPGTPKDVAQFRMEHQAHVDDQMMGPVRQVAGQLIAANNGQMDEQTAMREAGKKLITQMNLDEQKDYINLEHTLAEIAASKRAQSQNDRALTAGERRDRSVAIAEVHNAVREGQRLDSQIASIYGANHGILPTQDLKDQVAALKQAVVGYKQQAAMLAADLAGNYSGIQIGAVINGYPTIMVGQTQPQAGGRVRRPAGRSVTRAQVQRIADGEKISYEQAKRNAISHGNRVIE